MKKMMSVMLLLAALSLQSATAATAVQSRHAEKGVTCETCHAPGAQTAPARETCLKCHGPADKLAARTEKLNFESKMKNPKTGEVTSHKALVNPHDSYHFGTTLSCNECHNEHKPSRNDCSTCHDTDAWGIRALK